MRARPLWSGRAAGFAARTKSFDARKRSAVSVRTSSRQWPARGCPGRVEQVRHARFGVQESEQDVARNPSAGTGYLLTSIGPTLRGQPIMGNG